MRFAFCHVWSTSSESTFHRRTCPFWFPYSGLIQLRLPVQAGPETLQRLPGRLRGHLGVDLHHHREPGVTEDRHAPRAPRYGLGPAAEPSGGRYIRWTSLEWTVAFGR